MKRNQCGLFLRGYLDAAMFTADDNAPGGVDYVECGRADEMFPRLPKWFTDEAAKDCAKFELENAGLLEKAGSAWQNGSDFYYTRHHHGVGFWDRGYPKDVSEPLTEASHRYGEQDLSASDLE